MGKLDKTKSYGISFIGDNTYFGQDGKYFDMNTNEEVVPPVHKNTGYACRFCGAIRQTPELLKEHLMAIHPAQVPDLMPKPVAPETVADTETKKEETGTETEPKTTVDLVPTEEDLNKLTPKELKAMAKKSKTIEGYDNMDKPSLIQALRKAIAEALKNAPPQADK